jgi:hypothetical protein
MDEALWEDELDFNTSEIITPYDSVSAISAIVTTDRSFSETEQKIIDDFNQSGCIGRGIFQLVNVNVNGEVVTKWKCPICNSNFTNCKGTTSNLKKHLETAHSEVAKALTNKKVQKRSGSQVQQQTLKKGKLVSFTTKGMLQHFVRYAVVTDQSFLHFQHPAFRDMLEYLRPDVTVPNRKQVKEAMMDVFRDRKNELMGKLKDVQLISFTTDCWTSKNMKSFIALTYHYLNESFEMVSGLLDFIPIVGKHSGKSLANSLIQVFQNFGIHQNQVFTITVDNASNNDTLISHLITEKWLQDKECHIRCFAHIFNLAAQDLIESISDLIRQSKINNKFIRGSVGRLADLESLCKVNKENYRIPQLDSPTRWNSTYEMLRVNLTMQKSINDFIAKQGRNNSFIDEVDKELTIG